MYLWVSDSLTQLSFALFIFVAALCDLHLTWLLGFRGSSLGVQRVSYYLIYPLFGPTSEKALMDSCCVALKVNSHLVNVRNSGFGNGDYVFLGERIRGSLNNNSVWVNRVANSLSTYIKKAMKIKPGAFAVVTSKNPKEAKVCLILYPLYLFYCQWGPGKVTSVQVQVLFNLVLIMIDSSNICMIKDQLHHLLLKTWTLQWLFGETKSHSFFDFGFRPYRHVDSIDRELTPRMWLQSYWEEVQGLISFPLPEGLPHLL